MDHSHKPGPLHQQNKGRKSRHASKRANKKETGGRVNHQPHRSSVKFGATASSKQQRKHAQRAAQESKRSAVQRQRRQQETGPPKIVGFVALSANVSLDEAASVIVQDSSCTVVTQPMSPGSPVHVTAGPGRPVALTLAVAPRDTHAVLDLCKVIDVLVLVHTAGEDLDPWAEQIVSSVRAQGSPTTVGMLQNVASVAQKMRQGVRKDFLKFVRKNFPDKDEPKSFDTELDNERKLFVRHVCGLRPRQIQWRLQHPHMLVDNLAYSEDTLSLRVSGYLRARHLVADQLVHITGSGTHQLQQIEVHSAAAGKHRVGGAAALEEEGGGAAGDILRVAAEQRVSLRMENEVDELAGEQTWPTEEELAAADAARAAGAGTGGADVQQQRKALPAGTSDYQAAWYEGAEEDDDFSDTEAADGSDMSDGGLGHDGAAAQDGEHDEEMDTVDFEAVEAERAMRRANADEDTVFPDEIDTPLDTAARLRFARYRGVKSFRTSPWDPKESLPRTYAKIFELENFAVARQNALEQESEFEAAQVGQYVTLVLENVSAVAAATLKSRHFQPSTIPCPLVVSGLLAHENQLSVMHLAINRCEEYEDPVRSKDPMVVHVGFRRFVSRPIFSDHNANSDKAKLQRFMLGGFSVATMYAPISFAANCPALLFNPAAAASSLAGTAPAALTLRDAVSDQLVAMGGLLSVNPNRIILKRTILSGFPYKIHKTRAVVRYMFFNAVDIEWFKPIELHTKLGRTGHIRESVGTHGYMKCQFNQPLAGNDTICLNLYKRQFPPEWDSAWYDVM
jgi:pre-rRNA-processing protein TSR1